MENAKSILHEVFPIEDSIWVTWKFLTVNYGVKRKAIQVGTTRSRQNDLPSWVNRKHPHDKRINLVLLSSVPSRYKVPTEEEIREALQEKEQKKEQAKLEYRESKELERILQMLPSLSKRDSDVFEKYVVEQRKQDLDTGEVFYIKTGALPPKTEMKYKAECLFYALLTDDLNVGARLRISEAFEKPKAWREAIVKASKLYIERTGVKVKLSENDAVLLRNMKKYREQGAEAIISGRWGNINRRKLHVEDDEMLIKLMSDSRKPTIEQVHRNFNRWRAKEGKEEVSIRSVGDRLNEPSMKALWYAAHHGVDRWKQIFEHSNLIERPSMKNLVWVGDGTKVNYFYRDARSNRVAKLDVYEIVDVHSEYKLGWAFTTEGENARVILKALRMAIQKSSGVLPYQLLYDGDAANKLAYEQANEVMVSFNAQAYNAQSKIIESMFGREQRYIMTRNHFFTGQNAKSRSERGRLNQDRVKELGKKLPSYEEIVKIYEEDIAIWNAKVQKRDGKSPRQRYLESQERENARTLEDKEQMYLFWEFKSRLPSHKRASLKEADEITYRRDGLMLQWGTQKLFYEVAHADGQPDLDFLMENVSRKFKVKYDADDLDRQKVALFDTETGKFVRWANSKQALVRAVYDMEDGDRATAEKRMKLRKEQKATIKEVQERVQERYNDVEMDWLGMSKEEQAAAEAEMYESQLPPTSKEVLPPPLEETRGQREAIKTTPIAYPPDLEDNTDAEQDNSTDGSVANVHLVYIPQIFCRSIL